MSLVENNANVDIQNILGFTALINAVRSSSYNNNFNDWVVSILMEYNANMYMKTALLENDACLDILNNKNQTALMLAEENCRTEDMNLNCRKEIICLLIQVHQKDINCNKVPAKYRTL